MAVDHFTSSNRMTHSKNVKSSFFS